MEAKQSSRKSGQRIPMVMISNMAARHVCFTKRRRGLFKKLCELSTFCGTDLLAFVTSTAGKLYVIGTTDVPVAVERFLHMHAGEDAAAAAERPRESKDGHDRRIVLLEKLHEEIDALEGKLDELRKLRALLQRSMEEKAGRLPHQWVEKLGDLTTHELEEMIASLGELLAKVGFDPPAEMAPEVGAAALKHLISAAPETVVSGPMNVVGPVKYYSTPLPPVLSRRPQLRNRSDLVASAGSSHFWAPRNFLGQVNYYSGFNPSSVVPLPPAPSWSPSSMLYSTTAALSLTASPSTLISTTVNRPAVIPSGFRLFPSFRPPTADNKSTSETSDTSRIAMTNSAWPVPSSGRLLASANPPALYSFLPATPSPMLNMSGITRSASAMTHPLVPHSPSNMFTSSAAVPPPPHTNPGGRTTPSATGHVIRPPAAVAPAPQRVANDSTAPREVGQSIYSRGEECGKWDALPSSARASWELFDIPYDFDFVRDWSV